MATHLPSLIIRDIKGLSEMREVEQLQKDVWGIDDREVFPALALVPMVELGSVLIGAFDGGRMAGFVFGFPGYHLRQRVSVPTQDPQPGTLLGNPSENARIMLHSDMLAVRPEYRSAGLGHKLKLAQRERALADGIEIITWTFDPLQSLNAYLNFGKLGVLADRYCINYYGETTSFLHSTGTDRLWVTWLLNSERVKNRIAETSRPETPALAELPALVRLGDDEEPVSSEGQWVEPSLVIEIPDSINLLLKQNVELAVRWREATRNAFTKAMAAGFFVEEFYRIERGKKKVGIFVLRGGPAAI